MPVGYIPKSLTGRTVFKSVYHIQKEGLKEGRRDPFDLIDLEGKRLFFGELTLQEIHDLARSKAKQYAKREYPYEL